MFFQAEVFRAGRLTERRPRPSDTIIERARRVAVFRDCDVLVAGGGPAGTAAAIAAARAGADTVLVERHNHLGGLSTGGLVIWIDRMTDWSGQRVIEGIAAELIDRLPRAAVAGRHAPIGQRRRGDRRLLEGTNRGLSRHRCLAFRHEPGAAELRRLARRESGRRARAVATANLFKSAVPRLAKCAPAIPYRSKSSTRRGPTSGFDGDF